MDRLGVRNVARQIRYLDAHPEQAIQLVLSGHCFVFENGKALNPTEGGKEQERHDKMSMKECTITKH